MWTNAEEARARLGHDPVTEVAEGVRARVARRHRGGGRGDRHQLVGGQPDAQMRAEVRVQVDEPGRHQLARRVDALDGPVGRDARGAPPRSGRTDADVALAARLLHRIHHVAIGDHQLVLQPGIGGIEAERRGRPGLGDQERRPGRADRGRPVRVPLARECAAGRRRARGQGEEMPAREIDGSGWWRA